MKYRTLAIGVLLCGMAVAGAEDTGNLFPFGDMEEVVEDSGHINPKGWMPIGLIEYESDTADFKSGGRSLKIRTPDKPAVVSSDYILVRPNTAYDIEVSILARGDKETSRPSVGLRVQGSDNIDYPPGGEGYLITWSPSEEEVGFVTKKARFVTDGSTHKVRITLLVRNRPSGLVNVDDVILREADQTE